MSTPIQHLKEADNTIFLQVAVVYAFAIICVQLAASVTPALSLPFLLTSVLAWAVIGWCQFALFNALHEGLHNRFGRPHRELLGYILTAYTVGFDAGYRKVHLEHHKYFGDPKRDPDYPNYGKFPTSKRQFLWRFFLNLCGWHALLQFLGVHQSRRGVAGDEARRPGSLGKLVMTQLIVLLLFSLSLGWGFYIWLWLIPIATFGKFFSSTRAFCEHADPDDQPTIRTITGSFLGEKILGVFCFNYHAEHHRYVGIPYVHLAEANAVLADSVYAPAKPGEPNYLHYKHGYGRLLLTWFRSLPL